MQPTSKSSPPDQPPPDHGADDDPALVNFLGLPMRDVVNHTERVQAVGPALVRRLQQLVGGLDVDLHAALSADDE